MYCLAIKEQVQDVGLHERKITENLLVSMRLGDTPVPIPNTMVKT